MRKRPTSKELLSTGWSEGPGAPGSRPARARPTNAAARGEGAASQPFPSWAPAAPPLVRCGARAFHGCYIVARGGAPVREAARAPARAGWGSAAQCQRQHQTRAPRSPDRRLRSGSRVRAPARPCAARIWSCCAARAPGTRPGPGRTRDCSGTSVSCRACSAWRSATCPAPPTSSVCRGRSSRTCGRCWRTGCWRYGPEGSPLPRRPAPDILGPTCWDILVPTTIGKMLWWPRSPGPGFSLGYPSGPTASVVSLSLPQP